MVFRLPEVPETATAGVPVEVTIWTVDLCGYRIGETEVAVTDRVAEVTPFDYLTGDEVCSLLYEGHFEHKAKVVFPEPGFANIVLVYSTAMGRPESDNRDGRKVYSVKVSPAG